MKRMKGSPINGGLQPRHEDKGKGNGCNTQRNKNTDGEKETIIKIKDRLAIAIRSLKDRYVTIVS